MQQQQIGPTPFLLRYPASKLPRTFHELVRSEVLLLADREKRITHNNIFMQSCIRLTTQNLEDVPVYDLVLFWCYMAYFASDNSYADDPFMWQGVGGFQSLRQLLQHPQIALEDILVGMGPTDGIYNPSNPTACFPNVGFLQALFEIFIEQAVHVVTPLDTAAIAAEVTAASRSTMLTYLQVLETQRLWNSLIDTNPAVVSSAYPLDDTNIDTLRTYFHPSQIAHRKAYGTYNVTWKPCFFDRDRPDTFRRYWCPFLMPISAVVVGAMFPTIFNNPLEWSDTMFQNNIWAFRTIMHQRQAWESSAIPTPEQLERQIQIGYNALLLFRQCVFADLYHLFPLSILFGIAGTAWEMLESHPLTIPTKISQRYNRPWELFNDEDPALLNPSGIVTELVFANDTSCETSLMDFPSRKHSEDNELIIRDWFVEYTLRHTEEDQQALLYSLLPAKVIPMIRSWQPCLQYPSAALQRALQFFRDQLEVMWRSRNIALVGSPARGIPILLKQIRSQQIRRPGCTMNMESPIHLADPFFAALFQPLAATLEGLPQQLALPAPPSMAPSPPSSQLLPLLPPPPLSQLQLPALPHLQQLALPAPPSMAPPPPSSQLLPLLPPPPLSQLQLPAPPHLRPQLGIEYHSSVGGGGVPVLSAVPSRLATEHRPVAAAAATVGMTEAEPCLACHQVPVEAWVKAKFYQIWQQLPPERKAVILQEQKQFGREVRRHEWSPAEERREQSKYKAFSEFLSQVEASVGSQGLAIIRDAAVILLDLFATFPKQLQEFEQTGDVSYFIPIQEVHEGKQVVCLPCARRQDLIQLQAFAEPQAQLQQTIQPPLDPLRFSTTDIPPNVWCPFCTREEMAHLMTIPERFQTVSEPRPLENSNVSFANNAELGPRGIRRHNLVFYRPPALGPFPLDPSVPLTTTPAPHLPFEDPRLAINMGNIMLVGILREYYTGVVDITADRPKPAFAVVERLDALPANQSGHDFLGARMQVEDRYWHDVAPFGIDVVPLHWILPFAQESINLQQWQYDLGQANAEITLFSARSTQENVRTFLRWWLLVDGPMSQRHLQALQNPQIARPLYELYGGTKSSRAWAQPVLGAPPEPVLLTTNTPPPLEMARIIWLSVIGLLNTSLGNAYQREIGIAQISEAPYKSILSDIGATTHDVNDDNIRLHVVKEDKEPPYWFANSGLVQNMKQIRSVLKVLATCLTEKTFRDAPREKISWPSLLAELVGIAVFYRPDEIQTVLDRRRESVICKDQKVNVVAALRSIVALMFTPIGIGPDVPTFTNLDFDYFSILQEPRHTRDALFEQSVVRWPGYLWKGETVVRWHPHYFITIPTALPLFTFYLNEMDLPVSIAWFTSTGPVTFAKSSGARSGSYFGARYVHHPPLLEPETEQEQARAHPAKRKAQEDISPTSKRAKKP